MVFKLFSCSLEPKGRLAGCGILATNLTFLLQTLSRAINAWSPSTAALWVWSVYGQFFFFLGGEAFSSEYIFKVLVSYLLSK